jgi:mono/diheme cytochrome c family protein
MHTVSLAKCALLSLFLIASSQAQDSTFHDAPPTAKQQKNPFEGQHPASAKADYLQRCASCHGPNGEGTGNIPALATGKAQSASDG